MKWTYVCFNNYYWLFVAMSHSFESHSVQSSYIEFWTNTLIEGPLSNVQSGFFFLPNSNSSHRSLP